MYRQTHIYKRSSFCYTKHTHINLSIHYGSCARIIWSLTYDMWKYVLLFLVLIQVELNSTMSGTHIWKEKCQRVEQHGRVKNILTYIASNKYNDCSTDPKTCYRIFWYRVSVIKFILPYARKRTAQNKCITYTPEWYMSLYWNIKCA